jgi:hypothetical protein
VLIESFFCSNLVQIKIKNKLKIENYVEKLKPKTVTEGIKNIEKV